MSKRLSLLVFVPLLAASCALSSGDGTRTRPAPEQSGAHVLNAFGPGDSGDVVAATARAVARLEAAPPVVPNAVLPAAPGVGTLVLYDETGPWGWLGELYAINVGSLVSHFGTWKAKPASKYVAGEMAAYAGAVYVGSTFDEPLPTALLDDVLTTTKPVVWIDSNVWQLVARQPGFAASYGFEPWYFDTTPVSGVVYKGTTLTRHPANGAGVMLYTAPPAAPATVLATAVQTPSTTQIPWAVQGKNLFYIGENPMAYVTSNDRYLAFADILYSAFAPATPERHRALVRLEDVDAKADPVALRAIADYLFAQKVPFCVAVIPRYMDPKGHYNDGVREDIPLSRAPAVVSALKYMTTKGGTLLLHGYTHQYASANNPYSGVSGDDFEFYRAHIDASDFVIYDGPTPEDSVAWATDRIKRGMAEMKTAKLPAPTVFEFPHYAGSAADATAARGLFSTMYHRGLYFGGQLAGTAPNYTRQVGVMYPYPATDIYGFKVIPENLGSYEAEGSNNNPPRLPADLLATAHANRVVRDGFASFYFHPYYPIAVLKEVVAGIKADGYTFVSATSL